MKEKNKIKHKLLVLFSVLYFAILIYILFLWRLEYDYGISSFAEYLEWVKRKVNIIPFINIYGYATTPYITLGYTFDFLKNLIGNIVIFIPMGYFLPGLFEKMKKFKNYFLTVFLFSLSVELIQVLTLLGMFDIDDIILNIIGAIIGFFIIKEFNKLREKRKFNNRNS